MSTRKPLYKTDSEWHERLWTDFKDRFLAEYMESNAAIPIDEPVEDFQKLLRTKANTAFVKFVSKKRNDFIEDCKVKGEIWNKDAYPYNRGWIVNDDRIKKTLKRYPNLLDVLNFIDGEGKHVETIDAKEFISYIKETRLGPEIRKYSHVIVDKDFYRRAEETIGIKKITMQKYLQAFTQMGILKKIKQLKSHDRAMLYVDGYYRPVDAIGGMKKERFLNQKDQQRALRDFRY